jgi:hypothetical protein
MFNRRDFPDYMTESAYIRERHGPPPMTPEQHARWEAALRQQEIDIVAAYDSSESLAAVARRFGVTPYRVSRVIAKVTFERRFPTRESATSFLAGLYERLCRKCYYSYVVGQWQAWVGGRRATFPNPPACPHADSGRSQ